MKKLCLALLVLVGLAAATSGVRADTDEPLVTDRPDITESSRVVGSWRWQIETSAQRSQFKLDPVDTQTVVDPDALSLRSGQQAGATLHERPLFDDAFPGRLLEPIGSIPPAEYEAVFYQQEETPARVAGVM